MRLGKKLLSLCMVMILAFAVVACGGGEKKKTVTLTMEQNGVSLDYVMEAKGDKVTSIKQISYIDCSVYSDEEVESLMEMLDEYSATYAAYDCVDYSTKIQGDDLVETISIDTTDIDEVKALSAAGLVPIDTTNASFISLEKTIESLKSIGMTEKK